MRGEGEVQITKCRVSANATELPIARDDSLFRDVLPKKLTTRIVSPRDCQTPSTGAGVAEARGVARE